MFFRPIYNVERTIMQYLLKNILKKYKINF